MNSKSLTAFLVLGLLVTAHIQAANKSESQPSTPLKPLNQSSSQSLPTVQTPSAPSIKYKAGKDVDFEQLLIQGELKRPELSIVTGNVQPGSDGLLRLRENFNDRIATDVGEELP